MIALFARSIWLLWCWVELIIFTLILYPLSWLPKRFTSFFFHRLSRLWCRFFIHALGIKLYLHEKHIKALPKQYILVANHPSALEDFAIPALFNVYPLAKQGVRKWFLIGRISYAADTVFVKRDDPDSRHAAVEQMLAILEQGKNIVIFPEGGCKGRRIYKTFQYGAFDISLKTGIPILPVFLHYEGQDTFEWREPQTLIDKLWHFITSQNKRANFYLHDAIDPASFSNKEAYSEYVHECYLEWQTRYLE